MPFEKGQSGNPNGRPEGSKNKHPNTFKKALEAAYEALQAETGVEHGDLISWAKENRTEFYRIKSKLLPIQVEGSEENPLRLSVEVNYSG